jgi:hypothetical protein
MTELDKLLPTKLDLPLNQKNLIRQRLTQVAAEQELTLLYAVESGSRAWGFESPDSDWDVRFLYLRPKDYYLWNLDLKKRDCVDTVEYPIQSDHIDLAGWDLLKTCKLLLVSNPAALEWLTSPICYYNRLNILSELKALVPLVYSRRSAMYHYQHMAQTNWRKYISKKDPLLLKKYLYVLRPLLAMQWIERYKEPIPMLFDHLAQACDVPSPVSTEIRELLALKRSSSEKDYGSPLPAIHNWIAERVDLQSVALVPTRTPEVTEAAKQAVRAFFLKTLQTS